MLRKNRCTGCGRCVDVCPVGAIALSDQPLHVEWEACNHCGECAAVCPEKALEMVGQRMERQDLVRKAERDRAFYDTSQGGITVSGGEPLMQVDFLERFLEECRERSLDACLETCGYAPWDALKRVLPLIDLIFYDIKHMDPLKHQELTGKPNDLILENLRKAVLFGGRIIVRMPVVPGQNDDEENLVQLAEFVWDLRGIERVELLPYHRLGTAKYEGLGRQYLLREVAPPSMESLRYLQETITSRGVRCGLG
jgi:pyruvate formate lyase activating enzyme